MLLISSLCLSIPDLFEVMRRSVISIHWNDSVLFSNILKYEIQFKLPLIKKNIGTDGMGKISISCGSSAHSETEIR